MEENTDQRRKAVAAAFFWTWLASMPADEAIAALEELISYGGDLALIERKLALNIASEGKRL